MNSKTNKKDFYIQKTKWNDINVNVDNWDEGHTMGQYDVDKDKRRRQPEGKYTHKPDNVISIL